VIYAQALIEAAEQKAAMQATRRVRRHVVPRSSVNSPKEMRSPNVRLPPAQEGVSMRV